VTTETDAEQVVRLETIACGAAAERFNEELEKVLANIADINTDPEKSRAITLTITFQPNKMREQATVVVASVAKLAPVKPADSVVYFGKNRGRRIAVEFDPRQGSFFDQKRPTVVPLRGDIAEEGGKDS
jgi:hypothetical protein